MALAEQPLAQLCLKLCWTMPVWIMRLKHLLQTLKPVMAQAKPCLTSEGNTPHVLNLPGTAGAVDPIAPAENLHKEKSIAFCRQTG